MITVFRTAAILLAAFISGLLLYGCGQTGPLYLPEAPAAEKDPAASAAAGDSAQP